MISIFKKKDFRTSIILFFIISNLQLFSQEKLVKIKPKRNDDRSVSFYYEKDVPGTFFVQVKLSGLVNSNTGDFKGNIKNDSGVLFTIDPIDNKKPIKFSYKTKYIRGVYKAKIQEDFVYALPFQNGEKVIVAKNKNISEGFFGQEAPENWTSFGVKRIKPDTVKCIRKGVVVDIVDEFVYDSISKKFSSKTNKLLIEHPDGSFAAYKGFKKGSFLVKLGQQVYPHNSLGLLEKFNDSYKLNFQVFYLDPKITVLNKPKSETNKRVNKHIYINPFFKTDKGILQLEHKEEYEVVFDEDMFISDFTKKELKKIKKDKLKP